jgi:cell division protein FtsI (penicillin-binding protein 3)
VTVHDPSPRTYRSVPRVSGALRLLPSWRWLTEGILRIEHAFERARAEARPEEDTRVRIFFIMTVFCVVFSVLAVFAGRAALFVPAGGARGSAVGQLTRTDLVDRNGQLLATNITHYGLYIDPREVWDLDQARRQIRRALPEVPVERLDRVLAGQRRLVVMNGLTPAQREAVHDLALGGVTFEPENRRSYPLGDATSHVIGHADTGGVGIAGAELAFDAEIQAGGATGEPFALSIDLRVQGVLETELAAAAAETGAKAAVGIITDVQTGEVLGMASWPFDQSKNLAVSGHYEMGSVFKSITIAAGLDTGRADMNTLFDASETLMIGNRRIDDFHAQNRIMTLEDVYLHSSNIGTSRLAIEMGPVVMEDYFRRLGFLDAAPIELKESARPIRPREWSDSTLASLSFGYGISITPAQMIAAMGALTNGGRFVPLSLRKGGARQPQVRQVVSADTSVTVLDLMRRNVMRPAGSGGRAVAPGLRLGGKTGSANKWFEGRYDPMHAVGTFVAVFPTDGPLNAKRYAILVLIDEPSSYPRTGGFVAAPAVGRIADRIAPFLGVERRADRWSTADGKRIPQPDDEVAP